MEKASSKELMSLEEWEFLDFGHDGKDLPQKLFFDPKGIIDMNYFICPSRDPAHVETHQDDDAGVGVGGVGGGGGGDEPCKEFVKDIPVVVLPPDQDPVSQVFFKKMKDAEFVDMKMGSPRASAKLILPHAEPDPDPILFDEEEGLYSPKEVAEDKASKKNSAELREEEDNNNNNNNNMLCSEDKGSRLLEGIGFTVWRWRVNGIGALCSIGVAAAATICVFVLGGRQKQQHQHQHQKIQFQIYTEDKRIKQVVQQATRLNQAISAMRGAPITRAHISFGGYYDGL